METGTTPHLSPPRHGGDYTEEFGFALVNLNVLIVTADGVDFEASRGTGPRWQATGYEDCLVVVDAQGRSSVDLGHVCDASLHAVCVIRDTVIFLPRILISIVPNCVP